MIIARLRTVFATAGRRKLIADDPMKYVDNLSEPKPDVDPLTLKEATACLRRLRERTGRSSGCSSLPDFVRTKRWHLSGMILISTAR
jgi:hypothetical protein